jgi:hypothetical protein
MAASIFRAIGLGVASCAMALVGTLSGIATPSGASAQEPAALQSATSLPRVDIYGDSVTWESEYYMVLALNSRADVHVHVYPGAQVCQWFDDMRTTAAARPSMVFITGGLWGARDCNHTSDLFRELQDDAGTAAVIFSHSRVVFSADPPVLDSTEFAPTMGSKHYGQVVAAYRKAASLHRNASYNDAASAVAPKDRFVWTRPCLSNETAAMGCTAGTIKVRQPDGIHLCPVTPEQPGHCPVYSSGERRFAAAVTRPAVNAFPPHP